MAGLEARHPLRDPDLVEAVLALPPEAAFDPAIDRVLARRALAGRLPDAVLRDPRKPHFGRLLVDALTGPDREAALDLLEGDAVRARAYVEDGARRRLADAVRTGAGRPGWALDAWRLLTLETWLRQEVSG
jgi:asparagine synthase (glutamine-hydrolysing)